MRPLFILLALVPLIACAPQRVDTQAALQSPGCIGQGVEACVAVLKAGIMVDEGRTDASLARYQQIDVNGDVASTGKVSVAGRLPDLPGAIGFTVYSNGHDAVESVEARLPADPALAVTPADFAGTGLFEATALVLGSSCPGLTPVAIDRFFYNQLRPSVGQPVKGPGLTPSRFDVTYLAKTPPLPFCGHTLQYVVERGVSVAERQSGNRAGNFRFGFMLFR